MADDAHPSLRNTSRQPGALADRFLFPIRVYWEDTDAGGIVFYANYLKYFERARTEWLRAFGISQQALKTSTGCIFVVAETSLRYHAPARLDDQLLVTAELVRCDRASLTMAQQVFRSDPACESPENTGLAAPSSLLLCSGTIRIGWVEESTLRPARIPPSLLEILCP